MANSYSLKEEGNKRFRNGDYSAAETFYSQAIVVDPKNSSLYTNRANARLKLGLNDLAIADCNDCLSLAPSSMKGYFFLCQAQLPIDREAALASGLEAHKLCVELRDHKSLPAITATVLQCKKRRWEEKEKKREREAAQLERELVALLDKDREEMLADVGDDEVERRTVEEECQEKLVTLKGMFEKARGGEGKREVPDWAIDDISFGIMVDPVITKTGKSYERASILEHLRRSPTDPLTREPLTEQDLRPNLALRQACDEFLEHNGWAVDW